jgi:hypothetical protein
MEDRGNLFGMSGAKSNRVPQMKFAQGTMVAPHLNPTSINTQPVKILLKPN